MQPLTPAQQKKMSYDELCVVVLRCGNHIDVQKRDDGSHFCGRCGLDLKSCNKNKSGFRHSITPPKKKICTVDGCNDNKPQPIENFYPRHQALDGYSYRCRKCTKEAEKARKDVVKDSHVKRSFWIPIDLWKAINALRGKQTVRQFVDQALRTEVEKRTRQAMYDHAIQSTKRKRIGVR